MNTIPVYVDLTKLPMPYECCACGAAGVKLWRKYQTFLNHQDLKCRACSEKEQDTVLEVEFSNAIGWRVPAVPDDSGTFWGFCSTPTSNYNWWNSLPEAP